MVVFAAVCFGEYSTDGRKMKNYKSCTLAGSYWAAQFVLC
jgi:hypothetical protein